MKKLPFYDIKFKTYDYNYLCFQPIKVPVWFRFELQEQIAGQLHSQICWNICNNIRRDASDKIKFS